MKLLPGVKLCPVCCCKLQSGSPGPKGNMSGNCRPDPGTRYTQDLHDDLMNGRQSMWLVGTCKLAWLVLDAVPTGNEVQYATYPWHEDSTSMRSVVCTLNLDLPIHTFLCSHSSGKGARDRSTAHWHRALTLHRLPPHCLAPPPPCRRPLASPPHPPPRRYPPPPRHPWPPPVAS